MERSLFLRVQAECKKEGLFLVNNWKGLATVLFEIAFLSLIIWGIAYVERWSIGYWTLQLLGGASLFRWFVILHECGHKSLFNKVWMNSVAGHLASVFCLIPYFGWRNIHNLHHRWVGVIDKDPTQKHLLKLHQAGDVQNALFRFVWKFWLPVPFAKFLFEVFWGYPIVQHSHGDKRNTRLGWFSNLVCAAPHILAAAVFGLTTWAAFFLPMLLVFYFIIENMNLPQHSELFPYLSDTHPDPIPLSQQDTITRSTHLPDWLSIVLALNFNRHTEHHLYMAAPWYSLNSIRKKLHAHAYSHPHEVPFLKFMWKLRRRDPVQIYRDALPSITTLATPAKESV